MGWNSWDCFGVSVTEQDIKDNADYIAANLKQYGWEYVVVDLGWYAPDATVHNYKKYGLEQLIDEYGRLIPCPKKFPCSADGSGFKKLADYVHGLGLKFGIHIMRGMPFQAADQQCPVLGTDATCEQIAQPADRCFWYANNIGIKMTEPAGQSYYNSIFSLYAEWGVDFVKADDINSWDGDGQIYPYHTDEIEAVRKAIDSTGRPMVLSLSPGAALVCNANHLRKHANMWRISADFWDDWEALKRQFARCELWAPYIIEGAWPDPDMLPLGRIGIRGEVGVERKTNFLPNEQTTLMTLWSIFKAPLMFGGHLPGSDEDTLKLISNAEVLAVNQQGQCPKPLGRKGDLLAWSSDTSDGGKNVAIFNLGDLSASYTLFHKDFGLVGSAAVRDLWSQTDVGAFEGQYTFDVPAHGARLFKLSIA